MKKLIILVMLLTLSLSFTYAQATVGGWGRGIFAPVIMADGDPGSIVQASWGPYNMRMGFTVSGSSDNVGVRLDLTVDGGGVQAGDVQKIWVKPIEMLTISLGRIQDDTLRGSASFVAYNWLRPKKITGDDLVFHRVGEGDQMNAEIALTPVDGAYIYAAFGRSITPWNGYANHLNLQSPGGDEIMMTMLKEGQYGAGYDIPGIGSVRAQFIGMYSDPAGADSAWGIINAAFKLTMVEGLMVDIGGFIPTDSDQDGGRTATIALYGKYTMDTLALHLSGDLTLYDAAVSDPGFGVGLAVEYGLEGGLTAQLDLRYRNDVSSGLVNGQIDVGAFAKFSYSNGVFGIGAQITTNDFETSVSGKTDPDAIVFALPIRLEYWF